MSLTIEQTLQQGVAAHKEGKLQEAERLYRAILGVQPKHPDANHNLGLIAVSMNQSGVALPLFKSAIDVNPKIEQFWLSYIDALIKEKQFDNAKEVLEQAKKQGVKGEKLDVLETQLTPTAHVNEPILAVQKKSLSFSEKRRKLAENKKKKKRKKQNLKNINPPEEEINNLLQHYQSGRYDDAEKLAVSITERFPEHEFGWKALGTILSQTGRFSESLVPSQKAVQLVPQDAEAHYNLGITLQELGRLEEAEASYRRAIALKPDYAEAHSNLGSTLKELGRLDEAEASYTQAIALKPNHVKAHNNLGITLQELGRLDEAEASYNQAIALKPDFAEAHYNLGITLQELSRLDEAEASYRQAIALKPDYAEARYNLGNTLQELGRLDEAEASYNQAIALKPDLVEARYNLGNTLQELSRLDEAEASYRQAIALKPDYAEAHNNLGIVSYISGDIDSALVSLKKANSINPEFDTYELMYSIIQARRSREETEVNADNLIYRDHGSKLRANPLILNRLVERELITVLLQMNSRGLDSTNDARHGNGRCSPDFNLFKENHPLIKIVVEDLTSIMKTSVESDIHFAGTFFNILSAGGGSSPHNHLKELDGEHGLFLGRKKYSLVYYISVGDQNCSEPGTLKLFDPDEDILPCEGMIIIIPAGRKHSAVYGGKTERIMIGANFYSI